jgi:protein-S-isoprenylcysteine O-methyltransferase Ste14
LRFGAATIPDLLNVGFGSTLLLAALFVICRPPPLKQDSSISSFVIAIATAVWPLLIGLLTPMSPISPAGLIVQGYALILMFGAILALRFNFSILPQYRSMVTVGPYAIVRHPLYSAYLTFDAGTACDVGTSGAISLWITEAILLAWRAEREEKLLIESDPNYAQYSMRVPYKFLPLIY